MNNNFRKIRLPPKQKLWVKLTAVDQKGYELGQEAATLIIQRILDNKDLSEKPVTKILDTELIIRESSLIKKKK